MVLIQALNCMATKMGAGQLGMDITMETVDVIINNTERNLLYKDSMLFVNCISCQ